MKRLPEALANARLAAIVESSDDAIVGKDLNGIITDWNKSAERLFGYSAAEAVGHHISLIAPPGRAHEMDYVLSQIRKGEKVEHYQTQRRHKDGHLVDVSLTVSPILGADGEVTGASKIARDVTGQKRADAQGRLLAAIVNSSDDAIISKDPDGTITTWNVGAVRLFGYTPDEAIGRHISIIAVPGREDDMSNILETIRRGGRVEHYETQRRHKNGSIVDISLTVSPIHDEHGRIVGASKIARDISERRRTDRRLKLLMAELDHRAKNVLAVTQAILRLTRAETLPEFIATVEGRIRALARVHTEVAENRWDGAELRKLAANGLEAFGDRNGHTIIEGPELWVSPSAAQVVGVLLHELATNAAKHGALTAPDGFVEFRWHVDAEGTLHLSWAERGGPLVGMPERRSFGTQVIERSIPDQLGGTADIRWAPEGLVCDFTIPASYVVLLRHPVVERAIA